VEDQAALQRLKIVKNWANSSLAWTINGRLLVGVIKTITHFMQKIQYLELSRWTTKFSNHKLG
jgi:hypothetical protein